MGEGWSYLSSGPRKQAGSAMEVSKQLSVSPAVRWQRVGEPQRGPVLGKANLGFRILVSIQRKKIEKKKKKKPVL